MVLPEDKNTESLSTLTFDLDTSRGEDQHPVRAYNYRGILGRKPHSYRRQESTKLEY